MKDYKLIIPNEEQFQPVPDYKVRCLKYIHVPKGFNYEDYKGKMSHFSNNKIKDYNPKSNLDKIVLQNSKGLRTKARTKQ
ncbi:MAG TPA: hypothetical protein VJ912_01265 [Candidatus Nanoarchaeia archaeon]|nr:hypothetical protein [Candidatus Nanoarchaeia archaeon]